LYVALEQKLPQGSKILTSFLRQFQK